MRHALRYCVLGSAAVVAGLLTLWFRSTGESEPKRDRSTVAAILASYEKDRQYGDAAFTYPLDETLFPPEGVAPTFRWRDGQRSTDTWLITIQFADGGECEWHFSDEPEWTPTDKRWQSIKQRSLATEAEVTVLGFRRVNPADILSAACIAFSTSPDEVGAPIFYREVDLPFAQAAKDPSRIRWRMGRVSSVEQPRIVLQNLPVCGNCHSFSADGATLGMDVDYANNKGSYAITPVVKNTTLDKDDIITWSDYKREDGTQTFGLLSQVSPDGRYVVSTVKDHSVFVPKADISFSQLFFPIQGILVIYDRETGQFKALPGADDSQYVQSNPTWSPDGKSIIFARSRAYQLKHVRDRTSPLLTQTDCAEFLKGGKKFRYDLYRIPFNGGEGGEAKPLPGASDNGMSNYFARYSPDGKWIVFCQAESFMLLQPDSELHIIPAAGGEARRLRCNTWRMNSWHSWSPNSKWLVFSSKANSPYTQLFLTHIDEEGNSSPPVLLSRFTTADRAANIPEFVNARVGALNSIQEHFVDDQSYMRTAAENLRFGDLTAAEYFYREALLVNPQNALAHSNLGTVLAQRGNPKEALAHFTSALECDPNQTDVHNNLGGTLLRLGEVEQALVHCREAVRRDATSFPAQLNLGIALSQLGQLNEATHHLSQAIELAPSDPVAHCQLGIAWDKQGKLEPAAAQFELTLKYQPDYVPAIIALASIRMRAEAPPLQNHSEAVTLAERASELTRYQDPGVLDALARIYAGVGRPADAIFTTHKALRIAQSAGAKDLELALTHSLERYHRQSAAQLLKSL